MHKLLKVNFRKFNVYRKRYLQYDLIAALVTFLVAIPLCLGIALASGAPIASGILSGIIGGIIVGSLSSSQVSVSGPAAGMVAVVLAAISQLGDFNTFLLALFFSGFLQIFIGSLKAGFVADYVPSNVVQGLLCAIGILLIVKQLPLAFTMSSSLDELKANLLDTTEGFSFWPLYKISQHINNGATLISVISFGILMYSHKIQWRWLKSIPAPVLVIVTGILLNEIFLWLHSSLLQSSSYLVNLPEQENLATFFNHIHFPKWTALTNPKVYLYAVVIAIIASLETLLNVKAGEKLDKKHRYCSKDRELIAQGIGNTIAGLIGGIPVTSVIVRTSVNIQAGSKTKVSTILHGCFILFAVILIASWLNKIPLASLAAILIFTGYKLTKPAIYQDIYKQGIDRFIPFIATVLSIVAFNLLLGIIIGLCISLFCILKSNSQARIDIIKETYPGGEISRLVLPQQISFLNKAALSAELRSIPKNTQLIIDARDTDYIDKEIIELIKDFEQEQAPLKAISLNLIGFKQYYNIHNYINFIQVTTYDIQTNLKPYEVLNLLKEGNQRFLNETRIHRSLSTDFRYIAKNQHPIGIVLGCIDSRVPVETIFDMSLGDLFCVRVAGNVVNEDILASIEYGCHVVGAKLIVVLGHTRCGAIHAACDDLNMQDSHINKLLAKIKPVIHAETSIVDNRNSTNAKFVNKITELNIAYTLQKIYQSSKILQSMILDGSVGLVGAIYDVSSGQVTFHDYTPALAILKTDKKLLSKINNILIAANNNPISE